jgi:putative effector of murein hydrolase
VTLEWFLSAVIVAVATPTFGHFETMRPTWVRIVRWLAYLGITGLLGATVGRPWTLIWVLRLPAAQLAPASMWRGACATASTR